MKQTYFWAVVFLGSILGVTTSCSNGGKSTTSSSGSSSSSGSGGSTTELMGGAVQGTALSLTGTVSTLAGTAGSTGTTDGTGSAARFMQPFGLTTDGTSLYLTDSTSGVSGSGGGYTVRKINPSSGVVTTVAGTPDVYGITDATFSNPKGITSDGTYLYVVDNGANTIRKVDPSTGTITTFAGDGTTGYTNATGTSAEFDRPTDITTDNTNLYVVDTGNCAIRQIVIATKEVSTLAGMGTCTTQGQDGIGAAATFDEPYGITTDGTNLYVTDYLDDTVRQIVIKTGVVTTLAGSAGQTGTTDGTGSAARFWWPTLITTDGTNLYVSEGLGNYDVRKIVISSAVVTTVAGSSAKQGSTDGTGTAALFEEPMGVTSLGGKLYVNDMTNYTVREIQ